MIRKISIMLIFCMILPIILAVPVSATNLTEQLKTEMIKNAVIQEDSEKLVFDEVPLYNQCDYDTYSYGDGARTIATSGCGITALAMIATYLTDTVYTPIDLAEQFAAKYAWHGTSARIFPDSEKLLGLNYDKTTYSWDVAYEALKNGQVMVVLVDSRSIFTSGGHYIVLAGINEKGNIIVNDPNGANYNRLKNGFENGFYPEDIYYGAIGYYIYERKDAPLAEIDNVSFFAKEFTNEETFKEISNTINKAA